MMIWMFLVVAITIGFVTCGGYMVFSAVSGKGIPDPGKDSLFQTKIQYKLRGIIGAAFIVIGITIIFGIYKSF